ncbi:DUF3021 domain-containing protein (plasmid) [Mammaliicoccus sciuri]|uniref:DUF3021 domain-containing protein n=1 Tax=Mammaliicoccus sciuri TaxID=1296 RepID=UPI002DBDA31A|nr:DUF3021 domain-containing protein [Mammaliicoccus sciuri]MEB5648619.1 DUF3021 domain-containing protein [Mammaliicoccus sciuri]
MKRALLGILIGLSSGLVISIIFSLIFAKGQYEPVSPESTLGQYYYNHFTEVQVVIIATLVWACIGVTFSLGSYIFTHTDLTIVKTTILHFLTMLFIFFPLAILAGWFPIKLSALIIFFVIFIVVYIIIWSIVRSWTKRNIKEINSKLGGK